MGTFQGGDDTLEPGQLVGGTDGFVVIDSQDECPPLSGKMGMHRSDARIIQTGRDAVWFFYLAVFILHHQGLGSMDDSHLAQLDGSGRTSGAYSFPSGFSQDYLHPFVINIMVDGAGGIASSTHTSHEIVGVVASLLLVQLLLISSLMTDCRRATMSG